MPAALEAVCLKAMGRLPGDRYPSVRALIDDVEHWLADEPVSTYRDPPSTGLTRWGRRHRVAAMAIGALLVGSVAALAMALALGRPAPDEPAPEAAPTRVARAGR